MTTEYYRAGLRANLRSLDAQEAAKLVVKISKELGAECAREVAAAARDVSRDRGGDQDKKPEVGF